ncbi:MAG: MFS transporter [Dehalococcoidia bacterium]|nr:MFS transporter [Dehalococcoidia bacterium]
MPRHAFSLPIALYCKPSMHADDLSLSAPSSEVPGPVETTLSGAPLSSYRWVVLAAVVINNSAFTLVALSFGLLLPAIRDSLHLSETQAGWLGASLGLGFVATTIPVSVLMGKSHPVRLFGFSIIVGAAATAAQGAARSFWIFFLARLMVGLTSSMRGPARPMLTQQWHPRREISLASGLIVGLGGIAEAAALVVTPWILNATGSWRTTCYLYAAFGLATVVLWFTLVRQHTTPAFSQQVHTKARPSIPSLFRYRQILVLGTGAMTMTFGFTVSRTFWPTYMLEAHGLPLTHSGLILGVTAIVLIPSSVVQGYLGSRYGMRRIPLAFSGAAMVAGSVGMMLTGSLPLLVLCSVTQGLAWGFMAVAISYPYDLPGIDTLEVAVAVSAVVTIFMLGTIIGPVIAGAIADATGSLYIALMVSAVVPVGMCFAALRLHDLSRQPLPAAAPSIISAP